MKEILINVHPSNTKVCIVDQGKLEEFWVERKSLTKLVGNIYKGKVSNVLPGMHAAFVNIGLDRNAFLYAGDTLEFQEMLPSVEQKPLNLKAGDQIVCQVIKDQFGQKGARISMNISLPGRVLVLMPQYDYIAVSRKISNEEKRIELQEYISSIRPNGYGFILRTQSEYCSKEEIKEEMEELCQKWDKIKQDALFTPVCSLIYKEEDLAIRAVRDMFDDSIDRLVINDKKLFEEFKGAFPYLYSKKPEMFVCEQEQDDLLQKYDLYAQIEGLLQKKVELKSGANLIIDRTEALTVIDINTGKYVGERNLEDTVFETNKIAAVEIARQLRLRNIGGIVVIDFIDMTEQEHITQVLDILQRELLKDRVKTILVGMTPLGLVELTRKKERSMIESVMLQSCPYCQGNGYLFSDEHTVAKLKNKMNEYLCLPENKAMLITVAPSVATKMFNYRLLSKECSGIWINKRIYVVTDINMHLEDFKIEILKGSVLSLPNEAKLLH